jgi:hypothetical protein
MIRPSCRVCGKVLPNLRPNGKVRHPDSIYCDEFCREQYVRLYPPKKARRLNLQVMPLADLTGVNPRDWKRVAHRMMAHGRADTS